MKKIIPVGVLLLSSFHLLPAMALNDKIPTIPKEYSESSYVTKKVNINLIKQSSGSNIKTWALQVKGAEKISVVLNKILLPSGSWLEVSDNNGNQRKIYNQKMFYDGTRPQLITSPLNGNQLLIRLILPEGNSDKGNIIIDHYRYMPVSKTRAIIGTDQSQLAGCYKTINPQFYRKSRAVFIADDAGTAWNLAGGPYAITNHHIAGDAGPVSLSMLYNYQYPGCSSDEPLENTLTINSESVVIAGNGGADDWAVLKPDALAYEEAGIRQIFGTLAINASTNKSALENEPVFVTGFPGITPKKIASENDDGTACKIITGGDEKTLHHNCDTEGGSSGSPLISQKDLMVVGLHRAAVSSYNIAVLGPYLYQQIKQLAPDADKSSAATEGEGKLMVRDINQSPFLPTDPIDLQATEPLKITALYEGRLRDQGDYTLFSARVRSTNGNIEPAKIRLQEITPCGTDNLTTAEQCTQPGTRSLKVDILASDNPGMSMFTGWMTLHISNTQDQRLHNLVMPLAFTNYDPFTSPFTDESKVKNYTLTGKSQLTTDNITMVKNFGFVAVNAGQGPLTTVYGGTGYSKVRVPVKDDKGNISVINLRASRKTTCKPPLRPMNSLTGCGATKPAALVMDYLPEDNPQLTAGHYQGIFPVVAERDDVQQPLLINIDITR